MKQLIYIDNSDISVARRDFKNYVVPSLVAYANLEISNLDNVEYITDLYRKNKDELFELFYSGKNVILSWSVYSSTADYNSKLQLFGFLRTAGKSNVKNVVYVDASGMVMEALESLQYSDTKGILAILVAIETNFIISYHDGIYSRIRIDLTSEKWLFYQAINLPKLLK